MEVAAEAWMAEPLVVETHQTHLLRKVTMVELAQPLLQALILVVVVVVLLLRVATAAQMVAMAALEQHLQSPGRL